MKSKWFYSTLLVVLAMATAFVTKQQPLKPNQAIVLELHNGDANLNSAEEALTNVELHLLKIGAENVEVSSLVDGKFKITYYSNLDVSNVKRILSKTDFLTLHLSFNPDLPGNYDFPSNTNKNDFSLNIFEISANNGFDSGLGGKSAIEIKTDFNRFSNAEKQLPAFNNPKVKSYLELKANLKFTSEIEFLDENISIKIPESRAGPFLFWDSRLC